MQKPGNCLALTKTSVKKRNFFVKYLASSLVELCSRNFDGYFSLREKCPNTELFLVRIFLYSDWIPRFTLQISVLIPNTGKYRPEITPYLDTFHKVHDFPKTWLQIDLLYVFIRGSQHVSLVLFLKGLILRNCL